jgi:penicillin-binding protein 1C
MQKVSGITGAGPILHEIALYMQEKYPSESFKPVHGVVHKPVCAQSGLLAGENCPHVYEEVFDKNNLPSVCDGNHTGAKIRFHLISPTEQDVYKIDPAVAQASQQLLLKADCPDTCMWKIDGTVWEKALCQTGWPLMPGKHTVSCTCRGETKQTSFEVLP